MSEQNFDKALDQFRRLLEIMSILRAPNGCSWDRKQTHTTLRKYVLEEAQEVADAIDSGDVLELREELGDLAMIIAFHAQIATENGTFTMAEVLQGIAEKLIHRHPHVFGDIENAISPAEVVANWGEIKKEEKHQNSLLNVRMTEFNTFPSVLKAARTIQLEAAKVGFDFPDKKNAWEKIPEEVAELKEAIDNEAPDKIEEEMGDLLFSIVNTCRFLKIDPDTALRQANTKFIGRFKEVEEEVTQSGGFSGKTIEELDAIWNRLKKKPPA